VGTAGAFAGWVSLMGETSVGAVVYINVTAMVDLPKINNFWPIATFISFASILIVGIIWSSVFTVIKRIRNQNPSIFGNSDLEERVEALEKKCHKE
jgi:multisubunit Na+/H+ antiporter MnhE subunit